MEVSFLLMRPGGKRRGRLEKAVLPAEPLRVGLP
jgi:hypothetical protein